MSGCGLDSTAGEYEIKAFTKCSSWKSGSPSLQLAFEVAGDCSIQISPITDPDCADPTSETGYPYGAIQMRGYYFEDPTDGILKIRSLADTTRDVTK